jgi:putative methyltransferase (TIGR04325 family)
MELLKENNLIIWTKKSQLKYNKSVAWSSKLWIKSQLSKIQASIQKSSLDRNEKIIFNLLDKKSKSNRLLDIGGGVGSFFFSLKKKNLYLDYYILENKKFIQELKNYYIFEDKKFIDEFKKIKFFKKIPNKKFNIVFSVNSLHYINNWKKLFKKIIKKRPDYIIIINLPTVNVPTFFGYQKYYTYQLKVRFQNSKKFKLFFKNLNYNLVKNTTDLKSKITKKKYYEKNFFKKKFVKIKSETFIFRNNLN